MVKQNIGKEKWWKVDKEIKFIFEGWRKFDNGDREEIKFL